MSKKTYDRWSRTVAFILQVVGVIGIVFVPTFWAFTHRIELSLLPFFASLTTAGLGINVLGEIAASKIRPPQTLKDKEGRHESQLQTENG